MSGDDDDPLVKDWEARKIGGKGSVRMMKKGGERKSFRMTKKKGETVQSNMLVKREREKKNLKTKGEDISVRTEPKEQDNVQKAP